MVKLKIGRLGRKNSEKSIQKTITHLVSLPFNTSHPDKVKPEDTEKFEGMFVDVSKAYKVLTDVVKCTLTQDARALFDEFGHPDGKQAFQLGVALPEWLVEKVLFWL